MNGIATMSHNARLHFPTQVSPFVRGTRPASSTELNSDRQAFLSTPEEIIEEARQGRMFILADDEGRENEGDLVIPAQMATPEKINFMAGHGRGLICLALTKRRVDELGLPP